MLATIMVYLNVTNEQFVKTWLLCKTDLEYSLCSTISTTCTAIVRIGLGLCYV